MFRILKKFIIIAIYNTIIIPSVSLFLSNTSFSLIKPISKRITANIAPYNRKMKDGSGIKYKYKLNVKTKVDQPTNFYLKIVIPETTKNMNKHSFIIKCVDEENTTHYFLRMKYKSSIYLFLDSIMSFFLIKINMYEQTQILTKSLGLLGSDKHKSIDISLYIEDNILISEVFIDELTCCNFIRRWIYHHEVIFKILIYMFFMTILTFLSALQAYLYYRFKRIPSSVKIDETFDSFSSEDTVDDIINKVK